MACSHASTACALDALSGAPVAARGVGEGVRADAPAPVRPVAPGSRIPCGPDADGALTDGVELPVAGLADRAGPVAVGVVLLRITVEVLAASPQPASTTAPRSATAADLDIAPSIESERGVERPSRVAAPPLCIAQALRARAWRMGATAVLRSRASMGFPHRTSRR